ncbi:MAG: hypothetical protein JWQ40_382 [Segetibacter sp.]|nr:hypothetical protein [Segetibacter sp.]
MGVPTDERNATQRCLTGVLIPVPKMSLRVWS